MEQGWTGQHEQNAAPQEKGFLREAGWGIRWRGDEKEGRVGPASAFWR